jgi:hypothetical protein
MKEIDWKLDNELKSGLRRLEYEISVSTELINELSIELYRELYNQLYAELRWGLMDNLQKI